MVDSAINQPRTDTSWPCTKRIFAKLSCISAKIAHLALQVLLPLAHAPILHLAAVAKVPAAIEILSISSACFLYTAAIPALSQLSIRSSAVLVQLVACRASIVNGPATLLIMLVDLIWRLKNSSSPLALEGISVSSLGLKALLLECGANLAHQDSNTKLVLFLLAGGYGALQLFQTSIRAFKKISSEQMDASQKTDLLFQGVGCTLLGGCSIYSLVQGSTGFFAHRRSVQALESPFDRISEEHRDFHLSLVHKHQLPDTRNQSQLSCRALVIDGLSSAWGESADDQPVSFLSELANSCQIRLAQVSSPRSFCRVLKASAREFQKPLDVLLLMAHGNAEKIYLGPSYRFSGSPKEVSCLQQVLTDDAQMMLVGCETARGNHSLAELLARNLPGREVTGFTTPIDGHTLTMLTPINNGRFQLDSWYSAEDWTKTSEKLGELLLEWCKTRSVEDRDSCLFSLLSSQATPALISSLHPLLLSSYYRHFSQQPVSTPGAALRFRTPPQSDVCPAT